MKVYETSGLHIKAWLDDLEDGALNQAKNLAKLPFAFKHIAIMPDSHQGYGMPIGGVLATKGVIIPNAVGVDIGCGIISVKTNLIDIDVDSLKSILGKIRLKIPMGFKHHDKEQDWIGFGNIPDISVIKDNLMSAKKQLGTLGGGNHFIEIQKGSDGYIYIMIHSGSRNFGYQIAKKYNKIAQDLCRTWHSDIPKYSGEDGLAFLPLNTKVADEYRVAMNYALDFAYANRLRMLDLVRESFIEVVECTFSSDINIHHNYATLENHFGENVMVHRKGATSARHGELGIIAGSQGTKSYIVKGKGNTDSFMSCSHGAGRKMSRTKAQKNLDLKKEQDILNSQNILHAIRGNKDLDEASGAYKDIAVVMENQKDLVDIVVELTPMAVIKG